MRLNGILEVGAGKGDARAVSVDQQAESVEGSGPPIAVGTLVRQGSTLKSPMKKLRILRTLIMPSSQQFGASSHGGLPTTSVSSRT